MFFDQTIYNTAVAILTAIVTGGFVLVFVEIGNRKNRENDNYRQLMSPFLKKLSAYFRYVNWMNNRISYPKDKNANEQEFHYILNKMAKYGSRLIVSGGDYSVRSFSAEKLSEICYEINNIWYFYTRMNPQRLSWYDDVVAGQDLIDKELVKLNKSYIKLSGLDQLIKISSDFFIDEYQPIEAESFMHELIQRLYKIQSIFVGLSLFLVLIILCLLLCFSFSVLLIKVLTVSMVCLFGMSLLLLFIDEESQVNTLNLLEEKLIRNKKRK